MVAPQESQAGGCPDAEILVELARGVLAPEARALAAEHVRACGDCGHVLAAFTATGSCSDTTSWAMSAPLPGDLIAGKYRVERVIGRGGMGLVVGATHTQLGQEVALKLLLPQTRSQDEAAARFVREARAAAKLRSEHVVRVTDVGTLEGGAPFLVMELLDGIDLANLLRQKGPQSADDAIDYVVQACEGIAEAHAMGIVHRDLKPANLFLARRGIKVLDFGISKCVTESSVDLTRSGAVMGSPRYMSPEQMRSAKTIGTTADIWAMGCVLYELLTARPPFDADTAQGLAVAIAVDPAPRVRERRPELPVELERVILGCLEKDPARRIPSAVELVRRLAPLAPPRSRATVEQVLRPCTESHLALEPTVLAPSSEALRPPRRWTRPVAVAAALTVALATAGWLSVRSTAASGASLAARSVAAPPEAREAVQAPAAPEAPAVPEVAVAAASPSAQPPTSHTAPVMRRSPGASLPVAQAAVPTASGAPTSAPSTSAAAAPVDPHGLLERK